MKHRFARLAVSGVCIALVGAPISAAPVSASKIDDKKAQAEQLQRAIDANGEQISMLAERYNGARLRLDDAKRRIGGVEVQLAAAQANTERIQAIASRRAVDLYMGAGLRSPVAWLDAANVNEAGSRSTYAAVTADRDRRLLDGLRAARDDLDVAERNLEVARNVAQKQVDTLDAGQRNVEEANAKQVQLLAQVDGEIATLIEEEQARAAAAEKARSDARLEAMRVAAARTPVTAPSSTAGAPVATVDPVAADPAPVPVPTASVPSAGAAAAVAYAQAQLGKPYRYAAAGPDEFDCSGLTMMAWAQGGVSMPHYSGSQGDMFPRVPDDQLQPGDLVIYYPDHHHVAIYVGDGMTIAATQTGDFVKLQPVFRSSFQFAVRPG